MVERVLEVYAIYLWIMYFYQISYIDDCDDVDELSGCVIRRCDSRYGNWERSSYHGAYL